MKNTAATQTIILALSLDKERNCERVIIGDEHQVRIRMNGEDNASVLYDEERAIGSLLFDHERQSYKSWNAEAIYPLRNALLAPSGRKTLESTANTFLTSQEENHDPISIFVSYQCRKWYHDSYSLIGNEENSNQFTQQIMRLTNSFHNIIRAEKMVYSTTEVMTILEEYVRGSKYIGDIEMRTWHPFGHLNTEYLIITNSFIPALYYYFQYIKNQGLQIRQCKACGKLFLSTNKHYDLCSESCKKEKKRQSKQAYDARARENISDRRYNNTSQRMRNQIKRSIEKGLSEGKAEQINAAFRAFRREAIQRKKKIVTQEDTNMFADWLFAQERKFTQLCEKIEKA